MKNIKENKDVLLDIEDSFEEPLPLFFVEGDYEDVREDDFDLPSFLDEIITESLLDNDLPSRSRIWPRRRR